jgi:hypothetical protein
MPVHPCSTDLGIIECEAEVGAAVKPFEGLVACASQYRIACGFMSLETSANHGVSLDGLPVEPR